MFSSSKNGFAEKNTIYVFLRSVYMEEKNVKYVFLRTAEKNVISVFFFRGKKHYI